jgi:hypothetical protein
MADPGSRPELYHLASSAQRWQGQLLGTCPLGSAEGGSMAVAAGTQHCSNVYGRWVGHRTSGHSPLLLHGRWLQATIQLLPKSE